MQRDQWFQVLMGSQKRALGEIPENGEAEVPQDRIASEDLGETITDSEKARKPSRETRATQTNPRHAMQSALRIQAFEIPDQQEPEVASGQQPWPPVVGVESLAQALDVPIEVMLVENLIESRVERMGGTARQILRRHPHRALLRLSPSFAHRHRRRVVRDRSCRSPIQAFTTDGGRIP
jgi:hypothetical protein